MPTKKIAIISGGPGDERKISLLSAGSVWQAFSLAPFYVTRYNLPEDFPAFINALQNKEIDLVIPIIHGAWGEDGKLPALLEIFHVPYLFSNHLTSALAMDKNLTKKVLMNENIVMAPGALINENNFKDLDKIIKTWGWPIVAKPNDSGSSCGVFIAKDRNELMTGISGRESVLLEKFIKGRELTVAVTDVSGEAKALPAIEIIPKVSEWFDYKAKYSDGGSDEVCPAQIPEEIAEEMKKIALKIFKVLNCRDLARADFIWSQTDNKLYFLEINTVPGLSEASLSPKALRAAGSNLTDFFISLINKRLN